jgi:hypothetical protein
MNPDRIYTQYRDDALATLTTATEYSTFVAMPFGNRFSYRSGEIYEQIIKAAANHADHLNETPRRFAEPKRADSSPGTARVITESILTDILYSHLFMADLTFENEGVLIETGIAMGLKPNPQIILITQGDFSELHFDIRNIHVISYNEVDAVPKIAQAMIAAAKSFEADADRTIDSITRTLTPDAVIVLNRYGTFQKVNSAQSLWLGVAEEIFPGHRRAEERFEGATRELFSKRLAYTEYKAKAIPAGDAFGMHATDIGWVVIARIWPELAK